MIEPYSDDYHIVYGLHSGYPLCCVFSRVDNKKAGECAKCKEEGRSYKMHRCRNDIPACEPYLDMVVQGVVNSVHKKADAGAIDIALGHTLPLEKRIIDALHQRGYHHLLESDETYDETGESFYWVYSRLPS